ncbi:MAG: hypothetical protein HY532_00560 [Chloroflexi bacterium]|nr:hypothetical protein [Chloroflexota bacterium]
MTTKTPTQNPVAKEPKPNGRPRIDIPPDWLEEGLAQGLGLKRLAVYITHRMRAIDTKAQPVSPQTVARRLQERGRR